MRTVYLLPLEFLILVFNIDCSNHSQSNLEGKFLYADATYYLKELDFLTLEEKVVYQGKNNTDAITYLTKISDHEIFFSMNPFGHSPVLRSVDLKNYEARTLRKGTSPVFINEHNALFFYVVDQPYGPSASFSLYVSHLTNLEDALMICKISKEDSSRPDVRQRPVVQISSDVIVFSGPNKLVTEYNYITGKLSESSLRNLYPLAWKENNGELICCNTEGTKLFLVKWFNKSIQTLNLNMGHTGGWTYIKEKDILLFVKETIKGGDLYYYDFEHNEVEKLKSHSAPVSGVYFQQNQANVFKH